MWSNLWGPSQEAHDAEILTLSFGTAAVMAADNQLMEVVLLASGGRDRLVHLYNASRYLI